MASIRLMNRRASFFLFSVNAGTSERKIVPYVEQMDKKSAVPSAFLTKERGQARPCQRECRRTGEVGNDERFHIGRRR